MTTMVTERTKLFAGLADIIKANDGEVTGRGVTTTLTYDAAMFMKQSKVFISLKNPDAFELVDEDKIKGIVDIDDKGFAIEFITPDVNVKRKKATLKWESENLYFIPDNREVIEQVRGLI